MKALMAIVIVVQAATLFWLYVVTDSTMVHHRALYTECSRAYSPYATEELKEKYYDKHWTRQEACDFYMDHGFQLVSLRKWVADLEKRMN